MQRNVSTEGGLTIVELVISFTILTVMIFAVGTLTVSGTEAQEYARRLTRVTEVTQDVMDEFRLELVSAVRVFGNDAEGNASLAMFDLDTAPTPLLGARLPTIAANASIERDIAGNEITGNLLFTARLAWTDRFRCTSGREYVIDVYRWLVYYMTAVDGGPRNGHSRGLDFVRVPSEPLADGGAIDRITDPADRLEVLQHLHAATPDVNGVTRSPIEVVWMRGGDPVTNGTFRQINPSDFTLSNAPLAPRADPWRIVRKEQDVRGMFDYRHHSVASCFSRPAYGVGRFGIPVNPSATSGGFPHGFEVQVIGPSSARQVLLHLVVCSTNRKGQTAWADLQSVVDLREL